MHNFKLKNAKLQTAQDTMNKADFQALSDATEQSKIEHSRFLKKQALEKQMQDAALRKEILGMKEGGRYEYMW